MISVIIVTFNRSELLVKSVRSILEQTYGNFEIIIIDDGSTDDTELIVSGLSNKIFYHKMIKSGNLALLRNYGIKLSKGELIAFCDDDDLWYPNKLEVQLKYINEFNIVCSNAELIDLQEQCKGGIYCKDFKSNIQLNTVHLFLKNYIITSSVLLKKGILPDMPFDSFKYKSTAEDYDLWLKLSLNNSIYFINKSLIKYRIHSNLTYRKDNYPIIYLNGIDILYKYKLKVPRHFRKYAVWGIVKLRTDYIKLNIREKRLTVVFKEFVKLFYEIFNIGYLSLLFYQMKYPKKSLLNNFE